MAYDLDEHRRFHRQDLEERLRKSLAVDVVLALVLAAATIVVGVLYFGYPCLDHACVGGHCACVTAGLLNKTIAATIALLGAAVAAPLYYGFLRKFRRRRYQRWV